MGRATGVRPENKSSKNARRVDPEIATLLANMAMERLLNELDLLSKMYDVANFLELLDTVSYDHAGFEEVWGTTGNFLKAISQRNSSLSSQLSHVTQLAQMASGVVHPHGANTMDEKKQAKKLLSNLTKMQKAKAAEWDKNKEKAKQRLEESELKKTEKQNEALIKL